MCLMIWQHSNPFAWIERMISDTWCYKMLPVIIVFIAGVKFGVLWVLIQLK